MSKHLRNATRQLFINCYKNLTSRDEIHQAIIVFDSALLQRKSLLEDKTVIVELGESQPWVFG
jgi:hypothetical protein